MFRKKETEKNVYVKLTDKSVEFIKTVIIPELKINSPLTNMDICNIEDWIYNLEYTQYDEQGNDIRLNKIDSEKVLSAQELLSELTSIWGKENALEDLDDLNKRLGLI